MRTSTGIRDYVVPIMLLVGVLIAFVYALPLLSGKAIMNENTNQ